MESAPRTGIGNDQNSELTPSEMVESIDLRPEFEAVLNLIAEAGDIDKLTDMSEDSIAKLVKQQELTEEEKDILRVLVVEKVLSIIGEHKYPRQCKDTSEKLWHLIKPYGLKETDINRIVVAINEKKSTLSNYQSPATEAPTGADWVMRQTPKTDW